jgi:hypothetical protein
MNMERTVTLSNGAVLTVTFDGNWLSLTSHERNGLVILMNQVDALEVKKAPTRPSEPHAHTWGLRMPGQLDLSGIGAQLPAQSSTDATRSNESAGTEPEK